MCTLAFGAALFTAAQPPMVDITLVPASETQLEVRLRPDAAFAEYFSSSVFTIRWADQSPLGLGVCSQAPGTMIYHSVARSGPEHLDGGFVYQIFAGFGGATMGDAGASWQAHEEVVLCTLEVLNGPGAFELVNNAWTDAFNGSYYISLNGLDRTGGVYQSSGLSVNDGAAGSSVVMPNPSTGMFMVQLPVGERVTAYSVTDTMGRTIRKGAWPDGQIGRTVRLDLTGEPSGVYMLTLASEYQMVVHRLVVGG